MSNPLTDDNGKCTRIMWTATLLIACMSISIYDRSALLAQERRSAESDRVQAAVQQALQAEISGTLQERDASLKKAEAESAKVPAVNWHQGKVQVGSDWKTYDQIVSRAQVSKQLQQYREMRDKSEPTLASQYELAVYCRKHRLKEQAEAHWSAVIELDPDHEEARLALGFVRVGDNWLRPDEVTKEQNIATRVVNVVRTSANELQRLASQLSQGKVTGDEVVAYLNEHKDIYALPLWESTLSSTSGAGALAVIKVLSKMDQVEATRSLARHAVYSPYSEARSVARRELGSRDQNMYIPDLLDELHGPWLSNRQVMNQGTRLVSRYTLLADGKDKNQLRVLDDSFTISGDLGTASVLATGAASTNAFQQEQVRSQLNKQQAAKNKLIMEALSELTGVNNLEKPQDWWHWWDDKNEVYSTGLKPLETSYAYKNYDIVGQRPISRGASDSGRRVEVRRVDCLAGGTPVWTERGPVNIERIRMGDLVLAQHAESGELRLQPVLRTTVREPEQLIRIAIEVPNSRSAAEAETSVIRSSGGHPFWVSGQGWQRARVLEPGMRLHTTNGFVTVKSAELEDKEARTYNLIIADFHSYFAGSVGVLTHDNSAVEAVSNKVPGLIASTQ